MMPSKPCGDGGGGGGGGGGGEGGVGGGGKEKLHECWLIEARWSLKQCVSKDFFK